MSAIPLLLPPETPSPGVPLDLRPYQRSALGAPKAACRPWCKLGIAWAREHAPIEEIAT
jgi:hypothetical protein